MDVTAALIGSAFLLRGCLTLTNMRKSKQDGRQDTLLLTVAFLLSGCPPQKQDPNEA